MSDEHRPAGSDPESRADNTSDGVGTDPGHGTSQSTADSEEGDNRQDPGHKKPRGSWFGRHKALTILVTAAGLLLALAVGWIFYLGNQLDDVRRFSGDLDREGRPTRVQGDGINILLMGLDDIDGSRSQGVAMYDLLEADTWKPGLFRSDTLMVLHIEADRGAAQLVSIPRDSWVDVPGQGKAKINAAFSYGGPLLAAETVEDTFGIYIDHMMMIDFEGFKGLTEALGGVDVMVNETVTDSARKITWEKGVNHVEGERALAYVRQRYGLPNGDFDRIKRQQNFLRAVLTKTAAKRTLANPVKLTRLTQTLGQLIAVDEAFTNEKIRKLALNSRALRSQTTRFVTVPNTGSGMIGEASVVILDLKSARKMFQAIEKDQFESWYAANQVDELPDEGAR